MILSNTSMDEIINILDKVKHETTYLSGQKQENGRGVDRQLFIKKTDHLTEITTE